MAENLKSAGNEAYKRNEFQEALRLYRRALEVVRPDESLSLVPTIHNNCAMVHLRLCQWKDAIASASITLSSEPKNEKALHRRAQAYVALNNMPAALADATTAVQVAQYKDPSISALSTALRQQSKRMSSNFNPRKLPRTRPSTLSHVYEYQPLANDPSCNIFAADTENAIPPLALNDQEELCGYFGGAADGRHFFTTIAALGAELARTKAGSPMSTARIRLYINDINPAAIVRLAVLLIALDKLAMCGDLDSAVKDPRTADRETASAAFLLTNLFLGGALYEEQHRATAAILQNFIADPRRNLPRWLSLGPNAVEKITDAAKAMLKSTRSWNAELPRMKAYFEQASNVKAADGKAADGKAADAKAPAVVENVVASFFEDSLKLTDADINERFAHVEAKNAEERRAKLTQLRQIALSLPKQALNVAETYPALLADLSSWVQNFKLTPPAQVKYLSEQRAYLNATLVDDRWLSRGGNVQGFPRPDVLLSLTEETRDDAKARRPVIQLDLCADVMALTFCRAALGLRRFLRGSPAPELQVALRVGDVSTDLDELQRDGVAFDRILANNVGDYSGLMPILSSSSRALRPSKGRSTLRTNILLAPSLFQNPEHYIFENCRLRTSEVRTLLFMQPKVSDAIWKDLVFAAVEPRECGAAASEQVYEWLAGLFLATVRPAQRQKQPARLLSPLSMAAWVATAELARARHGDAGVVKLLRDLLGNQLVTRQRYPASAPEKAPTKKKPAPEQQVVRPYLAELRALFTLWLLPSFGNAISDADLFALGVPRSSLAFKVACQLPLPPEWRDDFTCGEPNNFSLGLVFFTGPNSAALERNWPNSLLQGEEGVHAFSVLHWDSPRHAVKFWLSTEDFVKLTRPEMQGRGRLYLADSYTLLDSQWVDVHALEVSEGADALPPLEPDNKAAAAPAAGVPAAAATALPVVERKEKRAEEKKAQPKRSDSPPDMVPLPQSPKPAAARSTSPVAKPAAAARSTSPVASPRAAPAAAPATVPVVPATVSGAPPASFGAVATSANFAAVSVTSAALLPATASEVSPTTADEPFEPFVSHAALAPKAAQEKGVPIDADRRIAEMDAQIRSLTIQLDQAKQEAAAANARASRFEAEIARMKEERRKEEEAWYAEKHGGGGGGGGKGRGRGRGRK